MNQGIVYALLAYITWGLLPLFWKIFASMSSWEILGHRVVWSFVFVALLLLVKKQWGAFRAVCRNKNNITPIVWCSLLISMNWLIFIWAVNHDHVVETSLGYYMNPLINVLLGVLFLKEKLGRSEWIAIALAAIGVIILTVSYGSIPWVSLSLALSFGLYGLVKKRMSMDPLFSLAGEVIVVLPIALIYLVYLGMNGSSTMGTLSTWQTILLLLMGVATCMPLFWFAQAARRLSLTTIGFVQYVAPTISLFIGVVLYNESFTSVHMVSFSFIWGALLLFTGSSLKRNANMLKANAKAKKQ